MPHPDDEAVFVSVMLRKLSSLKIKTKLLTFTKGEVSTLRYGLDEKADLGKVRIVETKNAMKVLGIKDFKVLNFGDGNLENQEKKITTFLKREIEKYKATHVVTLEPNGIYGHPDHIALTKFVSKVAKKQIKIIYATASPNSMMSKSAVKMAKKKVKPTSPKFELKLTFVESIKKFQALKAHQSQFKFDFFNPKTFFFVIKNKILTNEYFV